MLQALNFEIYCKLQQHLLKDTNCFVIKKNNK